MTQLAIHLGRSRTTVSNWANSDEIPSARGFNEMLDKICEILKCTPADLIESSPDKKD
ncbi:helix-turn-helix transcriptional regulator [Pseudanabaena sp. FACHB-2040]|nr:helix-turn-helix transcriptional regulator [Pseudanabaena sp. FACHB-2040]